MTRRVPIVATAVVLAAVATMVALGFWQLQRKEEKETQLARYEAAQALSSPVPWPSDPSEREAALFRYSEFECAQVRAVSATAGRSARGQLGWSHEATCLTARGGEARVALGWSTDAQDFAWEGGKVAGFVAPAGEGVKLIAITPPAGLDRLAAPDPRDIPNNHFAYAWQWFFFAATALGVYALALRPRWRS